MLLLSGFAVSFNSSTALFKTELVALTKHENVCMCTDMVMRCAFAHQMCVYFRTHEFIARAALMMDFGVSRSVKSGPTGQAVVSQERR